MQFCQQCCIDADRCPCETKGKSFEEMKAGVVVPVTYFENGQWAAKAYFFGIEDPINHSPDFRENCLKAAEAKFNEQYPNKTWHHMIAFSIDKFQTRSYNAFVLKQSKK